MKNYESLKKELIDAKEEDLTNQFQAFFNSDTELKNQVLEITKWIKNYLMFLDSLCSPDFLFPDQLKYRSFLYKIGEEHQCDPNIYQYMLPPETYQDWLLCLKYMNNKRAKEEKLRTHCDFLLEDLLLSKLKLFQSISAELQTQLTIIKKNYKGNSKLLTDCIESLQLYEKINTSLNATDSNQSLPLDDESKVDEPVENTFDFIFENESAKDFFKDFLEEIEKDRGKIIKADYIFIYYQMKKIELIKDVTLEKRIKFLQREIKDTDYSHIKFSRSDFKGVDGNSSRNRRLIFNVVKKKHERKKNLK